MKNMENIFGTSIDTYNLDRYEIDTYELKLKDKLKKIKDWCNKNYFINIIEIDDKNIENIYLLVIENKNLQ